MAPLSHLAHHAHQRHHKKQQHGPPPQVHEVFAHVGKAAGLYVLCVYGGTPYETQETALRRGVDVVVGTPGRIKDLMARNTLKLSEIRCVGGGWVCGCMGEGPHRVACLVAGGAWAVPARASGCGAGVGGGSARSLVHNTHTHD